MTTRRSVGAALLLVAGVLLAGCASIPGNGPVETGRRVDAVQNGPMEILALGPQPGADPSDLVRGFLQSAAAFTNDNETARQFLATDQQLRWRPRASVVIYPSTAALALTVSRNAVTTTEPAPDTVHSSSASPTGPTRPAGSKGGPAKGAAKGAGSSGAAPKSSGAAPKGTASAAPGGGASASPMTVPTASPPGPESTAAPRIGEAATVTVSVPVLARIDEWGVYTAAAPGETVSRTFTLIGTDQGWRISELDDGILIDQDIFHSTFRALPVYFADVTGKFLVPDVRWFPVSGASTRAALVSSLVTDLLNGPSPGLRPGVDTGAPHGTATTLNAVKVADYVATVDLNTAARKADARHRLMLKEQLEHTLTDDAQTVVTIAGVVVTVDQQVFDLQAPAPAASGQPAATQDQLVGPALAVMTDTSLVGLDPKGDVVRLDPLRGVVPVRGLGVPASTGNADPAVEAGGRAYAVLTGGRTRLVYAVPSGAVTTLILGHDLVAPEFDTFGWVWSAQRDSWGVLLAGRPGAGVLRVSAGWLDGYQLRSLRISSDGARALVVTERAGAGTQAWVRAVVRDASGQPTALAPPIRLLADAQDVTGASWADDSHAVVLARRAGGATTPWTVQIGGEVAAGPPVQGQSVTSDDEGDVYVTTSSGSTVSRVGPGWQEVKGILWASMPG